jgi:hypothetical protein
MSFRELVKKYLKSTKPYDVPEDHPFSQKSIEVNRVIRQAECFVNGHKFELRENRYFCIKCDLDYN